jgi:hypothetical protein
MDVATIARGGCALYEGCNINVLYCGMYRGELLVGSKYYSSGITSRWVFDFDYLLFIFSGNSLEVLKQAPIARPDRRMWGFDISKVL